MRKLAMTAWAVFVSAVAVFPVVAQTAPQATPDFKPYKLVGGWQFTNSNTGAKYGGDIEVAIESVDQKGVMRGRISYDGRQTNDKCGTKPLFTDTPVEAEITKKETDYNVSFQVNCSTGKSPRVFSWKLVCGQDGSCSQPSESAWGKGTTSLKEVR